jgi:hypothetical protein
MGKEIETPEQTMTRLKANMEKIGLLVGGKPISKKKFKELGIFFAYGKGANKSLVLYFGVPKENLFGFYIPFSIKNQNNALEEAYQVYTAFVTDKETRRPMSLFNFGYIQWGNSGIPPSLGDLRIS